MKNVVFAGSRGSRLYTLMRVTNQYLLPVCGRAIIFCPIQTLVDDGTREIILVTGCQNSIDFLRLFSGGKEFDLHRIHYAYQEGEGGITEHQECQPISRLSPFDCDNYSRFQRKVNSEVSPNN